MIFHPPFYNPPYFYNPTYRRNYINNYERKQSNINKKNSDNSTNKVSNYDTRSSNNNEFIEIFGIKLFFDDILILCLLFFLYKQNVNDPLLFIALLLLLLS